MNTSVLNKILALHQFFVYMMRRDSPSLPGERKWLTQIERCDDGRLLLHQTLAEGANPVGAALGTLDFFLVVLGVVVDVAQKVLDLLHPVLDAAELHGGGEREAAVEANARLELLEHEALEVLVVGRWW